MALSDPRAIFGIHSVAPYNIETGEFYGIAKVLTNSSIAINSELITLNGGSQKFPWAVENGLSTAEISLSVSQYDDFLIELAYGKKPTANSAETSGSITTLTNKSGTLVDATSGIASVGITTGSESDLKFGKYVVTATSASEVSIAVSSDVDFARGADGSYSTDLLVIGTATITDGAVSTLADYGIEFTGGTTVLLVAGETATFEVRPPNSKSMDVIIGGASDVVPEIGMIIYAAQRGTSQMTEIDVFRAKLSGLPMGFTANEFSVAELSAQAFYSSSRNGVLSMRTVSPV